MLRDIIELTTAAGASWLSLGEPLASGYPRHPSRARAAAQLQSFDAEKYLHRLS